MIKCLLWDFGDTLCDELSLWRGSAEWMEVYYSFAEENGIGAAWSLGHLDAQQVADRLASQLSLSPSQILAHFRRYELLEFFPRTYEYFRGRHLPQAIVTVNPALFRELAKRLDLSDVVDTVVISGEEGTDDKGILCELALSRMTGEFKNAEALLIDNKPGNLSQWSAHGGPGYLYLDDSTFAQDISPGIEGLVAAGSP